MQRSRFTLLVEFFVIGFELIFKNLLRIKILNCLEGELLEPNSRYNFLLKLK